MPHRSMPFAAIVLVLATYAVRLLAASVPAGIEAPMRFYVTEKAGGLATISYQKPSVVLAPYAADGLTELGRELDELFTVIVADAANR